MFDRFFKPKSDSPETTVVERPAPTVAGPGRRHRDRPADRRQARGDAARAGSPHRLGRVHPGPGGQRRPRHQRRGDGSHRARAPGQRGDRRGDRRPRDRDGQAPGEDRRRHRGLRRDARVQEARRRRAADRRRPRLLRRDGGQRHDLRRGDRDDQRDRRRARHRRGRASRRSAPSTTRSSRRSSRSGASPRRRARRVARTPPRRMRAAVRGAARSLRAAIANPAIRRVEAAYTGGIAGDWVLLVALLVVAYQAGGPLGGGHPRPRADAAGDADRDVRRRAGCPVRQRARAGRGQYPAIARGASGVLSESGWALRRRWCSSGRRSSHPPGSWSGPSSPPCCRPWPGCPKSSSRPTSCRAWARPSARSSGRCSAGSSSRRSASRRRWPWRRSCSSLATISVAGLDASEDRGAPVRPDQAAIKRPSIDRAPSGPSPGDPDRPSSSSTS